MNLINLINPLTTPPRDYDWKGVCGILLQLYVLFDSAPSQAPNVVVALGVLVGLGMILLPIVGICSLSSRRTRRVTDAILWSVLIEVR